MKTQPYDKAWMRRYYQEHKDEWYARRLKQDFGIAIERYNELFQAQSGRCAICGVSQIECVRRFSVDHDHETGVIRGLLCGGCNTALGNLSTPELLKSAIQYLENARTTH